MMSRLLPYNFLLGQTRQLISNRSQLFPDRTLLKFIMSAITLAQ